MRPRTVRVQPGRHVDSGTPEVVVARDDGGPVTRWQLAGEAAHLHRGAEGQARREVHADHVDGGAVDVDLEVQRAALGVKSPGTVPTARRPTARLGSLVITASPTTPLPVPLRFTCGHGSRCARPNGSSCTAAPVSSATIAAAERSPSAAYDSCTTITSASKLRSTPARS